MWLFKKTKTELIRTNLTGAISEFGRVVCYNNMVTSLIARCGSFKLQIETDMIWVMFTGRAILLPLQQLINWWNNNIP